MQIMKMTLIKFLDIFENKIFNKHPGEVTVKVNIFMNVFEVGDHTLWMVTVLCGWYYLLGWKFSLVDVVPSCVWADISKTHCF